MAFRGLLVRLVTALAVIEATFVTFGVHGVASCSWALNRGGTSLAPHHSDPLFLHPQTSQNRGNVNEDMRQFWLPNNQGNMVVSNNDKVLVSCPKVNFKPRSQGPSTMSLICKNNEFCDSRTQSNCYEVDDLRCNDAPGLTTKALKTSCGGGSGKIIQVGFDVQTAGFFEIMEICFDSQRSDAIYSHFSLVPEIRNYQRGARPDRFEPLDFFTGLNVENFYDRDEQERTFQRIFGERTTYFQNGQFLSRGHLTAFQDFVFYAHRAQTFLYINVAPQWISINSGNWGHLEERCHRYATENRKTLQVYTGTQGVLKLKKSNGEAKEIYLGPSNKIKVPKYFWRVVYDASSRRGVAFIASNNPFDGASVQTEMKNTFGCGEDSCSALGNWRFAWNADVSQGYVICCAADNNNIRQTFREFPTLSISGLLN